MVKSRVEARVRHPRHERRGEARLPGVVATLIAITLYVALPQQLLVAPRYVLPALELLLLVPLIAVNPKRLTRQTKAIRFFSLALVLVIAASNLTALGILIHELIHADVKDGRSLLVAALQVWLTNIIAFGLAYWELDRGGPVARTQAPRGELPWRTSASRRTRTTTRWRRSRTAPAAPRTGFRPSWTTCTSP